MQIRRGVECVARATQRFTLQRNHLWRQHPDETLDPCRKRLLELGGVEHRKDPIERVVRGDAIGQHQKRCKSRTLGFAKQGDVVPLAGSAKDRA